MKQLYKQTTVLAVCLAVLYSCTQETKIKDNTKQNTSITMKANTARDGNIAIQEEYDAAIKSGSVAKIKLFIKRHPNHSLSQSAKEILSQKLNQK